MKIISTLKTVALLEMSRIKDMLNGPPAPTLVSAVESALRDWQQAIKEMDHIDGELTEYVIYKVNAAERRYMALLEQAKREGVTAWPPSAGTFHPNEICAAGSTGEIENTSMCSS